MKPIPPHPLLRLGLAILLAPPLAASTADGTGIVTGRVSNLATGKYLNNARVALKGTDQVAFTDAYGESRLIKLPSGPAVLQVFYTDLDPQKIPLTLRAGETVERNVEPTSRSRCGVGDDVLQLDAFVVASAQQTDSQVLAQPLPDPIPLKIQSPSRKTTRLENNVLSLEFDNRTGSIRQITNLKTGTGHLHDPRGNRLAKLIVPTPEHVSRPLFSHEAGQPRMTMRGDTLEIAFPELRDRNGPAGVFLTVRVRLPEDSPEAFFSAEIRNESPHRVHEMWFPWLGGRHGTPGESRDVITTSRQTERDIYARLANSGKSTHTFGHHHLRLAQSPTHLLPMMDLSNGKEGLSYNKYEPRPSPHTLAFESPLYRREDVCLTWSWVTGVFVEPGQTWTSSEFGIGVHQGDWHATADRFRRWLDTWWKPCDTPPAVREKIGLFHIQARGFSGEPYNQFAVLPAVARDAGQYGVRDLMVWDPAASVYYRPDRGDFWEMPPARERELRQALAEVRALGFSVSSYVNWRLACEYNSTWERRKSLAQESLFGVPLFGFPCGTMDGGWYNDPGYEMGSHALCCGADGFRPYAHAVLERTFDLGFDAVAVDQASEPNYCLSRHHGHASPWEAWQRTYDWYGEVTRATRARSAGAYTLAEIPDLYNIQHIDLWWNWMWRRDNAWANVDVFRYVLPSMIPVWCIDENQRDVLAEAFAVGSFLAIATRDMTGRLSDAPELAAHVKRLARLRRDTAAFVAHGRFLDNRGLVVANGRAYVFSSAAGLAVTMANGQAEAQTLRIALTPEQVGPAPCGESLLHVEGAEPVAVSPVRRDGTWSMEVRVPGYGAAVWTLAHGSRGQTK